MAKKIEQIFLVIFGLLLIIVTGICLKKPMHNLIPVRMLIYTMIWIGLLCVGRMILVFFGRRLEQTGGKRLSVILLLVFLTIWAVLLYAAGGVARSYPHTDYGDVYKAADALARRLPVDNWDYFSRCTNNRFPMLFLSFLLRLGYSMGMQDGYYFVLAVQVFHTVVTAGCVFYLAGKEAVADSWTALMLMVLLTPIWGNIAFFYTDQLSFGYSVIAYTLLCVAFRNKSGKILKTFLIIAAGLLWGLAFQIKVTAVIALLAACIVAALRRRIWSNGKWIGIFLLCFVLAACGGALAVAALPCQENVERDSDPILYWVALGLNGDGSYAANQDFAWQCRQAENVAEREVIVMEKIKSDWRNFFSAEHLAAKMRRNFACGDLGASGYMTYPFKEGNILYETISWDGKYFWKYACLSTSYLFAMFLLMAVGAFRAAGSGAPDDGVLCAYVAVFGIMLFLMLWEAQNKQLFNHSGWIVLASGYGLQIIGRRKDINCIKQEL